MTVVPFPALPSLSRLVIPPAWLPVISTVSQMFPGAVLCGGALRDLVWGRERLVKDLDFVVPRPFKGIWDSQSLKPQSWFMSHHFAGDYFGFRQDVVSVEGYDTGTGPSVELIYLDCPSSALAPRVIARNDFGCCQIVFVPHTDMFMWSNAFERDVDSNTFTLINCEDETQARRSLKRADRWTAKYPDVRFDLSAAYQFIRENLDAA